MLYFFPLFTTLSALASEHSIVNGDVAEDLPQVVALLATGADNGQSLLFCSGTVIGPRTVVTAAHCVDAMDEATDAGYPRLLVVSGTDIPEIKGSSEEVYANFWVAHPEYNPLGLHHDIGVIGLEHEFSFPVMPVNKDPLDVSAIGADYRYVGWGKTLDNADDSGVKRYADIPLYDFDGMFQYGFDDEDTQNACNGDSGGAALEFQHSGRLELSGVISWGNDNDSTPCLGGFSASTRIDTHLDWLELYTALWSAEELAALPTPTSEGLDTGADEGAVLPDELPAFQPEEQLPEDSAGCSTVPAPAGLGLGAGMLLFRRRRPSSPPKGPAPRPGTLPPLHAVARTAQRAGS